MIEELKNHIRPEDFGAVELWIFLNEQLARRAGFRGARMRREDINAIAWTLPMSGESIRGMRLCRVVITDEVGRYLHECKDERVKANFRIALENARFMLRYGAMAWIEL